MFNLEQAIAEWRQRMRAAGIQSPVPLEELEGHLREDVEAKMGSGLDPAQAFAGAVEEIGQTHDLKSEFSKTGGTIYEHWKQSIRTRAGIPEYQVATNMNTNTSQPASEPRWATYGKVMAWVLPAMVLWVGSLVMVLPKLKQLCAVSNTVLPAPMLFVLALSDLLKSNLLLVLAATGLVLGGLEWRSRIWDRRRRLLLGVGAFLLNSFVLVFISALLVLAVIAASNLLPHHR